MIDYHAQLVDALNGVLPTYYEMMLTSKTPTPCISYMETNNYTQHTGDTLGYSVVSYQVKVWSEYIADIQKYSKQVDDVLRPLGFTRTASLELGDNQSPMIQKIMTYQATGLENY